ncbi:MAG TPA: ABC transporter permease subunit, partial [Thermomicrobiales bacterium]
MLTSIYTKTLRGYWIPILAWGFGLALVVYGTLSAFATQFSSPQARNEFVALANAFRFLAEPIAVTTPAGFVTWRTFGTLPVMLGIWSVLAGARLIRGAEERGSLDLVLATPRSRARFLAEGIGALLTAHLLIGLLIGLGAFGGTAAAAEAVPLGRALLAGLNIALLDFFFALLALLISHFTGRAGAAAGVAGGLLALSWTVDGASRVVAGGAWLGRLSPFHLYSLNKPLIASYDSHPAAFLGLLALTIICGMLSVPLFINRDLGGVVWTRRDATGHPDTAAALDRAAREAGLRGVLPLALRTELPSVGWWVCGMGALTLLVIGITRATKDSVSNALSSSPAFSEIFARGGLATDAGFLSGLLFFFLPIMVAVYALSVAVGWARSLDAGYFELVLATPVSRRRVFLDSWGATIVGLFVAPLALWLLALLGIRIWGLDVAGGRLLAAFVGFLPFELLIAAFVYLIAGRLGAGAALGLGGGLLVVSFLLQLIGPLLKWPEAILGLSIFHQYGAPVVEGPRWGPWLVMVALAGVLLALGFVRFTRTDLQRG